MINESSAQIDRSFDRLERQARKEMMDPLTRLVLSEMDSLRSWMRQNPYMHLPALPGAINRTNDLLVAKGMIGRVVRVTGKLRPTLKGMSNESELFDTLEEPEYCKIANNLQFGERYEDEAGPYYMVASQPVYCGTIDAAYDDSNSPGELQSLVSLNIITDPDEDPDDTYFAIGRDEIELFTTDEPSTEMVAEILERDYPDIYDTLRAIPKGEDDISKLLKALDKFKLYIDWTAYPHQHEEDLAALEAMISEYLTDRISLDGGLYKLKVKGCLVIIELTEDGPAPYFMPIKDPMTIRGYVQGFHLFERANPKDVPEEVSTYELKLRVLARIHGGGNQDIEIPISSLVKLKSLSNDLLLPSALKAAEEDHFEQIIAIDRSTIEPQSSARTDATLVYSTETPVNTLSDEETASETIDDEEEYDPSPAEYIAERIGYYEEAIATLEVFMAKCDVYRSTYYSNQSEALQELNEVRAYVIQALGDLIQRDVHITFRGKEVKMMPADISFTSESNQISFNAKTSGVIKNNPDSRIGGTLNGCEVHLVADSDDEDVEKVRINIDFLISDDNSAMTLALGDREVKQEYLRANIIRAFRAEVSGNTEFTLTVHDWLNRVRDRIYDFADKSPENIEIADNMMQLFAVVDQLSVQPQSYALPVEDFHYFNDLMIDDPGKSHDIEMILTEIFDEKIIAVEGDYYTDDGVLFKNKSIERGWVAGVFVPTEGPCAGECVFLLRIKDKETVRVPIRRITRIMY